MLDLVSHTVPADISAANPIFLIRKVLCFCEIWGMYVCIDLWGTTLKSQPSLRAIPVRSIHLNRVSYIHIYLNMNARTCRQGTKILVFGCTNYRTNKTFCHLNKVN